MFEPSASSPDHDARRLRWDAPHGGVDPEETSGAPHLFSRMPSPKVDGYEILVELGRGGMGVVYKARQLLLERVVALKMILEGTHASSAQLVRFYTEARAVARLHHPNIVQVHAIGAQDGWPYFALEFIAGGSLAKEIAEFEERTKQPNDNTHWQARFRSSATLIETLALAVHYAHEHGIIHRDLKPANILLASVVRRPLSVAKDQEQLTTDHGQLTTPKITDFGLALFADAPPGLTSSRAILGTPSYIGPEQAEYRREQIGPHTDVYALGAILYELLTGQPPFRASTAVETLWQVLHEEPVSPRRLRPSVPRDLETICLKCLEKEPARRYASAASLADDLHRLLSGEPIHARRIRAHERIRRWFRRRPGLVSSMAFSTLMLLSFLAGVVWYQTGPAVRQERRTQAARQHRERADREQQASEANLQRVRQAMHLLLRVDHEQLTQLPDAGQVRRAFLDEAVRFDDGTLQSDPVLAHELGRACVRLADLHHRQGEFAAAEAAYSRAISLLEPISGVRGQGSGVSKDGASAPLTTDHRPLTTVPSAAQHHLALCYLNLGVLFKTTGRSAEAEEAYRRSSSIHERLIKESPFPPGYWHGLSLSLGNLAVLFQEREQWAEAEEAYRQTIALQVKLTAAEPARPHHLHALALSHSNLGTLLQTVERVTEAEECYRDALGILERLAAEHATVADYRQALAGTYQRLATLLQVTDRTEEAELHYRAAMEILDHLVVDSPPPACRHELAQCRYNLAVLLQNTSRGGEAADLFRQALGSFEKLAADFSAVNEYQKDRQAVREALGGLAGGP